MNKCVIAILLGMLLLPTVACAEILPVAATYLATHLDGQIVQRMGMLEPPAKGMGLVVTTPVSVNNLHQTTPLGRQMAEELANWFVQAGYNVQEIRKGKNILMAPERGELLMTRHERLLDETDIKTTLILTGTYIVTSKHIRFNIRLIQASTNTVMAMSSKTLPMTRETLETLHQSGGTQLSAITPSTGTRLPRTY